jgi:hypothetical protein
MMKHVRLALLVGTLLVIAHGGARGDGQDERLVNPNPDRLWTSKAGGWFTAGKSIAVIVGISNYVGVRNGGYPALPTARPDANKMKRFLLDDAGFDVVHVLTDDSATKEKIERLMTDQIPREVGTHDRFLFYWSGHGDQMLSADKSAFGFLPLASSKLQEFSSMISMEDIARWDRYLSARHALFVLDACLSGLAGVESKSARDTRLEQLSQVAHQLITAGTATESVISSDKWRGSLFTDSFILGARADARHSFGVVSLYSLIDFIQERVSLEKDAMRWSSTLTPQMRNLRAGDGSFFFTRSASAGEIGRPGNEKVAVEPKASPAQTPQPPAQPAPASANQQATSTPPPAPPPSAVLQLPMTLSDKDNIRFANFAQNRAEAISKAKASPDSPRDAATLASVLEGAETPIASSSLIGEWRCRTVKLGGNFGSLTIYDYFKCRILREGNSLIFQKTSGSQRTRGTLYPVTNMRYAYVGAGTVNDDPPIPYGAKASEDQVAYLVQVDAKRLRLEFPKPFYESDFDIVELVR